MVTDTEAVGASTTVIEEVMGGVSFAGSVSTSSTIPAFIPADQAYFWSIQWQDAERAALADIAAGHMHSFADPSQAIRYLLGT